jgi:hypothetical protein
MIVDILAYKPGGTATHRVVKQEFYDRPHGSACRSAVSLAFDGALIELRRLDIIRKIKGGDLQLRPELRKRLT